MRSKRIPVFISALMLLGVGCKKNPVDRLMNPLPEGDVPGTSGIYTIYDDELKTGGGLALIPEAANQSIDLNDQSSPRRSTSQVRYSWNGQDVSDDGVPQHLFAGFQFIVSADAQSLPATPARDLSGAGYTKLTLYVRGNLSTNTKLRIEGPDDANELTATTMTEISSLNSEWTQVTVSGIPNSQFSNIKSFITVSFQYAQPPNTNNAGEGGVVYLDDIRYEQ